MPVLALTISFKYSSYSIFIRHSNFNPIWNSLLISILKTNTVLEFEITPRVNRLNAGRDNDAVAFSTC